MRVKSAEEHFVVCRRYKNGPCLKFAYVYIWLTPNQTMDLDFFIRWARWNIREWRRIQRCSPWSNQFGRIWHQIRRDRYYPKYQRCTFCPRQTHKTQRKSQTDDTPWHYYPRKNEKNNDLGYGTLPAQIECPQKFFGCILNNCKDSSGSLTYRGQLELNKIYEIIDHWAAMHLYLEFTAPWIENESYEQE